MRNGMAGMRPRGFKEGPAISILCALHNIFLRKEHSMASKGFFSRALASFTAARSRQADRYVTGALLGLDDATLAAAGYDRAELVRRAHRTSAL